jgi:cyclase
MALRSNRRGFLQAALGAGAGLTLSQLAARPALSHVLPSPTLANHLNDHLVVLTGAGANSVALRGSDGASALLVDGGLSERSKDLIKAALRETGTRRIQTVVNTHWHPEQTGSNERLGKEGATIVAHENTRLWLGYEQEVPWENRTYGPLSPKARPNETLYDSEKTTFGGEQIDYGYLLQAHTDGDIYVFFRESNVLAAGGVVSGEGWPVIDWKTGGWIGGLVEGLKTLAKVTDSHTRIVPANGPLLTHNDLVSQRDMYATIFDRLQKLLRKGLSADEVVAEHPTKEFDGKWGEPTQFVTMAFKSLWGHFAPDA